MKGVSRQVFAGFTAGLLLLSAFSCTVAFEGELSSLEAKCDSETEKRCGFDCVKKSEPSTGCAEKDSCVPCTVAHGSARCDEHGTCQIRDCIVPWADCDRDKDNGCETNIFTDKDNCGGCDIAACKNGLDNVAEPACLAEAETGEYVQGNCGIGRCQPGYGDCNEDVSDGCEQDVRDDVANCGQCGNACKTEELCQLGVCVSPAGS